MKEYFKKYNADNREHINKLHRDYYHRRKKADKNYNRIKIPKEYVDNRKKQLKLEVFEHYGNKCLVCGDSDENHLCLDHLKNDGHTYRDKHISGWYSGAGWLKSNGWPNDVVQILCFNCNSKKYIKRFKKDEYSETTTRLHEIKLEVKIKYGGRCSICGCSDIEILQLDHVNGGGNKERKELGNGRKGVGARKIYKKLYAEKNILSDYRILCPNCNMSSIHIS